MRRLPELPLPTAPFLPGRGPHPRSLPDHLPELDVETGSPEHTIRWRYGLDLFDAGCFWEAHEVWEGLWLAQDRTSDEATLIQGAIQLAASHLTALLGRQAASARLRVRAVARLTRVRRGMESRAWGIDWDRWIGPQPPQTPSPPR